MSKQPTEVTGNPWLIRDLNRRLIVNALKENSPISRADLAKVTRLSLPTVTRIIEDLCAERLVTALGKGSSSGGRPPLMLEFNAGISYVSGVHIGEHKIRVALSDMDGNIVDSTERPHTSNRDYKNVVKQVLSEIAALMERSGRSRSSLVAIGLAIPGMVDSDNGLVLKAVNMPGWVNAPIRELMQDEWRVPVFLDKEPNMAALGEHWRGAGEGKNNMVYLDFGTGIGAGIIINGKLYHGSHYGAGEIGYMGMGQRRFKLMNLDRGHFEVLASIDTIKKRIAAIIQREMGKNVDDIELITAIAKINKEPNGTAAHVLRKTGKIMGNAIANICSVLDPDIVIIGGDTIALAGALLLNEINRVVRTLLPASPKVITSSLGEKAPILGAIRVVLEHANYVLATNK